MLDAGRGVGNAQQGLFGGDTQAREQGFIVATHMDGQPMALGGLGPLWAIPDADRVPELAAKPLAQRFGGCPWSLYHIDVAA